MAEPTLPVFAFVAWVLAGLVVVLTRISSPEEPAGSRTRSRQDVQGTVTSDSSPATRGDREGESDREGPGAWDAGVSHSLERLSTELLFANALLTHGSILVVLVVAVMLSGVSVADLGIDSFEIELFSVWTGFVAGLALYVVDESLSVAMKHVDLVPADLLRSALAPTSLRGWLLLFIGILPLVSLAEELLFRGALIGATLALGLSPLVVILASSLLFGFAHGIQGIGGVVVAGFLGLGLGVVFIWTESLLVVVIAHYVVNALEFLVHEGLDWPS